MRAAARQLEAALAGELLQHVAAGTPAFFESLVVRPPAPEVFVPAFTTGPAAPTRPAPPAKLPVVERPTVH